MGPPFTAGLRKSIKQNESGESNSTKNISKGSVDETTPSTRKIKIPNFKLFSCVKLKRSTKRNSGEQNVLTKSNGSRSPKNNGKSIVDGISPPRTGERKPRNTGKSIINKISPSSSEGIKTPNLKVFTYAELKNATGNFGPDTVLGEGGFGRVFKGWISKNTYVPSKPGIGIAVAVKKSNPNSRQGLREWQSEIKFLGNLSHPNIIKLLGYCSSEDKEYLLVYEYATKGSLENHLFRSGVLTEPLPWAIRLKIAIGAARSLAFLHTLEKPIIYRDFKASNIMLDEDYNAKLSDFGLATYADLNHDSQVTTQFRDMLGPTNGDIEVTTQISWASGNTQVTTNITSASANSDAQVTTHISYSNGGTQVTTHIRRARGVTGTYGYAAPEYVATGRVRVESDVYSFGVVLLELLTGLRALDRNRPRGQQNLVSWAKPLLSHEEKFMRIMDGRLEDQYPRKGAYKAAQLASLCLASEPEDRPSMVIVLRVLEKINAYKLDNEGAQSQSSACNGPTQRTTVRKSASL